MDTSQNLGGDCIATRTATCCVEFINMELRLHFLDGAAFEM